jgi:Tfp pilus assembly ATPase PilU
MAMERLFQLMKEKNASDMFFAVNSPVHIKINGNLIPINQHKLDRKTSSRCCPKSPRPSRWPNSSAPTN